MGAILVLDKMPENCMECPLRFQDGDTDDWFRFRCFASTDQIPKEGRLCNCELKPMPIKEEGFAYYQTRDGVWHKPSEVGYAGGWNACIDEILGEKQ